MKREMRGKQGTQNADGIPHAPHNVSGMVFEGHDADASLDIPKDARHVARRGDDLPVVDETAAGEVARMSAELLCTLNGTGLLATKVVD